MLQILSISKMVEELLLHDTINKMVMDQAMDHEIISKMVVDPVMDGVIIMDLDVTMDGITMDEMDPIPTGIMDGIIMDRGTIPVITVVMEDHHNNYVQTHHLDPLVQSTRMCVHGMALPVDVDGDFPVLRATMTRIHVNCVPM